MHADEQAASHRNTAKMTHLFSPPDTEVIRRDVERALSEDIGSGDATADLLDAESMATARVITREPAVLAGQPLRFDACFRALDPGDG